MNFPILVLSAMLSFAPSNGAEVDTLYDYQASTEIDSPSNLNKKERNKGGLKFNMRGLTAENKHGTSININPFRPSVLLSFGKGYFLNLMYPKIGLYSLFVVRGRTFLVNNLPGALAFTSLYMLNWHRLPPKKLAKKFAAAMDDYAGPLMPIKAGIKAFTNGLIKLK